MVDVTCSVVSDRNEFLSLREPWQKLHQELEAPFSLDWYWLDCWLDVYNEEISELRILVFEAGGLIGFCPLYLNRNRWGLNSLRFIGDSAGSVDEVLPEYLGMLAADRWKERCLFAALNTKVFDRIANVELRLTQSMGITTAFIDRMDSLGFQVQRSESQAFRMSVNSDSQADIPSRSMKKRVLRSRSRISSEFPHQKWCIQRFDPQDQTAFEQANLEMMHLHNHRWQAQNSLGVFESTRFVEFHKRLMNCADSASVVPVNYLFLLGDRIIAAVYVLETYRYLHFYQSGWDTTLSRYNPMYIMHVELAMDAQRRGKQYDLMVGGLDSYKAKLGASQSSVTTYFFRNLSVVSKIKRIATRIADKALRKIA